MTQDRKGPREAERRGSAKPVKTAPSTTDPYDIAYFKRHKDDDPSESVPGKEFIETCPLTVRARMQNVLIAVASAPPHRFSGGGYWEAMSGDMAGYHEVRVDGPSRTHYRLFCKLDTNAEGDKLLLTIIGGASKPFRTEFSSAVYDKVRELGEEYLSRNPRSLA